jgi:hypothetical protein
MNRSFSKIRHIQESNVRLEKRVLKEETDEVQDEALQKIIEFDEELDNDPLYKEYEKKYARNRIMKLIQDKMGIDVMNDMDEEDREAMIDMFIGFTDLSRGGNKPKITRDSLLSRKEFLVNTVNDMIEMAVEDEEFDLATKLRDYNEMVSDYK